MREKPIGIIKENNLIKRKEKKKWDKKGDERCKQCIFGI
jgi:hypothetical protein